MLSVPVQKDASKMQSKIVGSLTARSLACCAIAVGASMLIGAYCYFILQIPFDFTIYVIIIITMPIWAAGFYHPYGMNLEDFVPLWFKHNFGTNHICYKSTFLISGFGEDSPRTRALQLKKSKEESPVTKQYQMLCKRPDIEALDIPIDSFSEGDK